MVIRISQRDLQRLSSAARRRAKGKGVAIRGGAKTSKHGVEQQEPQIAVDGARLGRSEREHFPGNRITIDFNVPPQPKERARTYINSGAIARAFINASGDIRKFMASLKSSGAGSGVMKSTTPEATRNFEMAISVLARRAMAGSGQEPFTCPVEMEIEFRFAGDPSSWPTAHSDGDLDNLEKSIKDALIGITYADDRLIVRKQSIKVCAEVPGIIVTIGPATP